MADKTFQVKVVAPERTFYEGEAGFIEFNTTEGQVGIYAKHVPTTSIIAPGVLRIHEAEGVKEAALLSGFVEVLQDSITILAESVEWPDEIDANRAKEAKIRAERRLNKEENDIDFDRAELALKRAIVRLLLAR
ncbi:MAG: ATP synthase F1 subunit epsilon [Lachnospiraceae bacterium]|nr:ATP synthase F1 subunit epsilon [Lachnospiraceae bacterium]